MNDQEVIENMEMLLNVDLDLISDEQDLEIIRDLPTLENAPDTEGEK